MQGSLTFSLSIKPRMKTNLCPVAINKTLIDKNIDRIKNFKKESKIIHTFSFLPILKNLNKKSNKIIPLHCITFIIF